VTKLKKEYATLLENVRLARKNNGNKPKEEPKQDKETK